MWIKSYAKAAIFLSGSAFLVGITDPNKKIPIVKYEFKSFGHEFIVEEIYIYLLLLKNLEDYLLNSVHQTYNR